MADNSLQAGSDAERAARFLAGDPAGFEEIVRKHSKPVFNFIRRHLGDREAARDVFQETMLSALASLSKYDGKRPLLPWLLGIALNRCREQFRKRGRSDADPEALLSLPDPAKSPAQAASDAEAAARVAQAVADLDEAHRAVFLLRVYEGCTYAQIGEILNISEGTAKSRMHHAVYTVRMKLR